jgi:hypothetical protein
MIQGNKININEMRRRTSNRRITSKGEERN